MCAELSELKRTLQSLACGKVRVLNKEPKVRLGSVPGNRSEIGVGTAVCSWVDYSTNIYQGSVCASAQRVLPCDSGEITLAGSRPALHACGSASPFCLRCCHIVCVNVLGAVMLTNISYK
jgi:hypothetical protein